MALADSTGDSHLRMLASLARTLATSSQDIRTEKTAEVHKPSAFLGDMSKCPKHFSTTVLTRFSKNQACLAQFYITKRRKKSVMNNFPW